MMFNGFYEVEVVGMTLALTEDRVSQVGDVIATTGEVEQAIAQFALESGKGR